MSTIVQFLHKDLEHYMKHYGTLRKFWDYYEDSGELIGNIQETQWQDQPNPCMHALKYMFF